MLHVSVSAYKQAGAVIRFTERWAGEGFVGIPEGREAVVECTITTRVDGDVLEVFWSYCLKLALLKSPVTTNAASGYTVSCSLILPYSSLRAWSVLA